jgi:hypothetical protein
MIEALAAILVDLVQALSHALAGREDEAFKAMLAGQSKIMAEVARRTLK